MQRHTNPALPNGTLLWIGPRKLADFQQAYDFCEQTTSQIAIRCNLEDAFSRPAQCVGGIVVAHDDRSAVDADAIQKLCADCGCNNLLLLLGSLSIGNRSQVRINFPHTAWHRWNQLLPNMLRSCGFQPNDNFSRARSVAVVASTLSAADPLLDLATSCNVTAVWCRSGSSTRARNFDVVWWDDSVAKPAVSAAWQQRVQSFAHQAKTNQAHYWLATGPQIHQIAEAIRGGIQDVFSKPASIESLIDTIEQYGHQEVDSVIAPQRIAA